MSAISRRVAAFSLRDHMESVGLTRVLVWDRESGEGRIGVAADGEAAIALSRVLRYRGFEAAPFFDGGVWHVVAY